MDRDSRSADTDNVVLVEARRRRLLWVPRDLWSQLLGDRINVAYRLGGDPLRAALREQDSLPRPASSCAAAPSSAPSRGFA
jgi:hypothetical protein